MFMQRNLQHLLDEYSIDGKQTATISDDLRRMIVHHVVDLMVDRFGLKPSKFIKTFISKAAVILFPCIRYKGSLDGIVSENSYVKILFKDFFPN